MSLIDDGRKPDWRIYYGIGKCMSMLGIESNYFLRGSNIKLSC